MKVVLLERELQEDKAGNYRSRALEEAIEVEHLKHILFKRDLRGDAAGSYRCRALGETIEVEFLMMP